MTTPAFRPLLRLSTVALTTLVLAACGDDGTTTVTSTVSGTGTGTDPTSAQTEPNPSGNSNTDIEPTTAGGNSLSGSETGSSSGTSTVTDPTSTSSSTTNTTAPDTTNPIDTDPSGTSSTTTLTTVSTSSTEAGETSLSTSGTTTTGGEETTEEPAGPCACADIEVPLDNGIFVLSDTAEVWKFFPDDFHFEKLGAFNCGGMTNAFSMAVDRLGFAWIMFNPVAGDIWKVDLTSPGDCIDPGYSPGQQGVSLFGMAFVSNGGGDVCDSLYGNSYDGFGGFAEGNKIGDFINVDPDTNVLTKIGKTNFNGAEVTGTGDGRAFLFGGVNPSKLVEVDKTTGAFINVLPLPGLELTNAFAFAFFAGDFYMFTEDDGFGFFSKVTHLDYDESEGMGKKLTTVVTSAPIRIVGAGVSTCAPFLPQ